MFEAIPATLTELLMPRMQVSDRDRRGRGDRRPGAWSSTTALGIYDGHAARFVKRYADVRDEMIKGVKAFAEDVRTRRYPEPAHGRTMAPDEIDRLHELMHESTGGSRSRAVSRSRPVSTNVAGLGPRTEPSR